MDYSQIQQAISNGNLELAIGLCDELAASGDCTPNPALFKGLALYRLGSHDQSASAFYENIMLHAGGLEGLCKPCAEVIAECGFDARRLVDTYGPQNEAEEVEAGVDDEPELNFISEEFKPPQDSASTLELRTAGQDVVRNDLVQGSSEGASRSEEDIIADYLLLTILEMSSRTAPSRLAVTISGRDLALEVRAPLDCRLALANACQSLRAQSVGFHVEEQNRIGDICVRLLSAARSVNG